MDAVFVAGGESLSLRAVHLTMLRGLGRLLGARQLLIRVGPTSGEVIHAFCEGLNSVSNRLAEVLVVLPEGYTKDNLDPLLRDIATVIPSQKDHGHRNRDEIGDSRWVIALFGGGKTYREIVDAKDLHKPIVMLEGPGDAIRMVRKDVDVSDVVTFASDPYEVTSFLDSPVQELAAG